MSGYYILVNGEVQPTDMFTWSGWFERGTAAQRRVAFDKIGDVEVSTVFLGLDHSFGGGPPMIFETLIFGGERDGEMWRYSTMKQAKEGHAEVVASLGGI